MESFNELLSKNRISIMGFAMISILLYHQNWVSFGVLQYARILGYIGVEVFLLISGFGIAHSLEKNSLRRFYFNRVNRLLPPCFIYGLLLVLFSSLAFFPSRTHYWLLDLFSLSHWYIYAVTIYYVIAPLLYKLVTRMGWWVLITVSLISLFIVGIWKVDENAPYFLYYGRWVLKRLPVFILGLTLALRPLTVRMATVIGFICCILNLFLFQCIVRANADPDILSFPAKCFVGLPMNHDIPDQGRFLIDMLSVLFICPLLCLFSAVFAFLRLHSAVNWIGRHSLELYLSHQYIFKSFQEGLNLNPGVEFTLALITVAFVSVFIAYISSLVRRLVEDLMSTCISGA